jgi:hypothetical protein
LVVQFNVGHSSTLTGGAVHALADGECWRRTAEGTPGDELPELAIGSDPVFASGPGWIDKYDAFGERPTRRRRRPTTSAHRGLDARVRSPPDLSFLVRARRVGDKDGERTVASHGTVQIETIVAGGRVGYRRSQRKRRRNVRDRKVSSVALADDVLSVSGGGKLRVLA